MKGTFKAGPNYTALSRVKSPKKKVSTLMVNFNHPKSSLIQRQSKNGEKSNKSKFKLSILYSLTAASTSFFKLNVLNINLLCPHSHFSGPVHHH